MVDKNILIIDDDPIFCFILQKQLPKDIIPFTNVFNKAKDALDYLIGRHPDETKFLIFLDLNMPSIDGLEFLDTVIASKQHYDLKVVILTSSINFVDKIKASSYSEIIGFFEKPITEQELLTTLSAF